MNAAFELSSYYTASAPASSAAATAQHEEFKDPYSCSICMLDFDPSEPKFNFSKCTHEFCIQCSKSVMEIALNENKVPICPEPGCGKRADPTDIEKMGSLAPDFPVKDMMAKYFDITTG